MLNIFLTIYLILLNVFYSNSAKILAFYQAPCISHQLYFRSLTTELLKRGHELTVITTDPAFSNGTAPKNIREIDLRDTSYKFWKNISEMPIGNSDDLIIQMHIIYETSSNVFEKQLKTWTVKSLLENEGNKFDLLLYDGSMVAPLILSYIYKIPVIAINSLGGVYGSYEIMGAVVNEGYFPSNLESAAAQNQIERLQAVFNYYFNQFNTLWYIEKVQNEAVKNALGNHMPDIRNLKKIINMMFINLYSAWDSHRPVPISLKYMGGLHSVLNNPLPKDIKSYLDSSTNGVIYMSLGTTVNLSRLPQEMIQMFAKVFSQLPYDVLWKWDFDTMRNKPRNVRLFKWLPQSDVLKHPKIQLFITQGGLQSTEEAITAGVPLIGIPLFGDQWFNTEKYVRYNIGLQLDFSALSENLFRNAIHSVLGNKSYYTNIIRHRSLMRDQPQKPLNHAANWIEYVIKHGGSHLQAPAADISWAEYVELELFITVIAVIGSVIAGLCFGLYFAMGVIYRRFKSKSNE